jgi:putative DNA primase/helicase
MTTNGKAALGGGSFRKHHDAASVAKPRFNRERLGAPDMNSIHATIDQFINAMAQTDAMPSNPASILADGQLHRHHVDGDRQGTLNGWHVVHLDGIPSGAFGSWKAGSCYAWSAKRDRQPTPAELAEQRQRVEQARRQAQAGRQRLHADAARRALDYWQASVPADPNHPYLVKKAIAPRCARQYGDRLVLPIISLGTERLCSLQFIAPDAQKRFLAHGEIRAHVIPIQICGAERVLLTEGFASAATVAQLDNSGTVLAGLFAGNLKEAAQAIKRRWPKCLLTIVADADPVGVTKAREAAKASGARVIIPRLTPHEIAAGFTDINDMMRAHGFAAAMGQVCHG